MQRREILKLIEFKTQIDFPAMKPLILEVRRTAVGWLFVACNLLLVACAGTTPQPLPEITAVATSSPTAAPTVIPAGLYVDVTHSQGEISPLVYGTNYGPWLTVPLDVVDEFQQSGLTLLRFPGGQYGDENDIRAFDVDQLKFFADQIEAEIVVSVRLLDGTPEQAVALMKLINEEKGVNVKYWSIGNEPSLFATMYQSEVWDTVYYNQRWREFAEAMRAADPDIKLVGPDIHQFTIREEDSPKDASGRDWMREFLLANGDMVDIVSFHRYPFPVSSTDPIPALDELRNNVYEWDKIVPRLRELIVETTGRELPIAVMEVNSNWTSAAGSETTPDSLFNAIWWGDVLGRMIKQQVFMVGHFALQHRSSGWGMLARTEPRPTYFVYQLYQRFGSELLFSASDDPLVSVYAARRNDGTLTIMVVNLGDEAVNKSLAVHGLKVTEAAEVWRLDAAHMAENLGAQPFTGQIELPGQSLTLFVFPGS